jgi:amino acid transporter
MGVPNLANYRVEIALACITLVTVVNLRGVKESGVIFSVPTYIFTASIIGMLLAGFAQVAASGWVVAAPKLQTAVQPAETVGLFLLLRAFAAGCTALTGVEAISNGVPAFRQPESRNAATTLLWMIAILGTMFLGMSILAHFYGTVPREGVSVVSQLASQIVGTGAAFFTIQIATALILVLATNTSYADFPRLSSLLSHDRFVPRQFSSRGDRLVFSNGVVAPGAFSALLIILFNAREQAMLPLYAIGVFISFTLSQLGMVRHWLRVQEPGWQRSMIVNGIGAVLTATVLIIIIVTKFTHGAWAALVLMPIVVLMFRGIHYHYKQVTRRLSLEQINYVEPVKRNTAVVLISGIHRGVIPALEFAKSLAQDNVTALYVNLDDEQTAKLQAKWSQWGCEVPLNVLESP